MSTNAQSLSDEFTQLLRDYKVYSSQTIVDILLEASNYDNLGAEITVAQYIEFFEDKGLESNEQMAQAFLESVKLNSHANFVASGDMSMIMTVEKINKFAQTLPTLPITNHAKQVKGTTSDRPPTPTITGTRLEFSTPKHNLTARDNTHQSFSDFSSFDSHTTPSRGGAHKRSSMNLLATPSSTKKGRSPWTRILSTPSSSLREHVEKGAAVVSIYARNMPKITTRSMFDENDDDDDADTQPSKKKIPIYVLSHIQAERESRQNRVRDPSLSYIHKIRNPHHPAHCSDLSQVDETDPFKTTTPFRYMDWDANIAVTLAREREAAIGEEIFESQIVQEVIAKINNNSQTTGEDNTNTNINTNNTNTNTNNDDDGPNRLRSITDFSRQQISSAWYVGHIKNTLPSREVYDPKAQYTLTQNTLLLSNYTSEVSIKLTHTNILQYSLFPGQVILCRGTCVAGDCLMPEYIFTESTLPKYQRFRQLQQYWNYYYYAAQKRLQAVQLTTNSATSTTTKISLIRKTPAEPVVQETKVEEKKSDVPTVNDLLALQDKAPVRVMYCNGPFIASENEVQAITSIIETIRNQEHTPDILILTGPFVDSESASLQQFNKRMQVKYDPSFLVGKSESGCDLNEISANPNTMGDTDNNITMEAETPGSAGIVSLCDVPVYKTDIFNKMNLPSANSAPDEEINIFSYQDLFTEIMDTIIKLLNEDKKTKNMTVITVPSPRDLHHFASFPQPAFTYHYTPSDAFSNDSQNSVRIINAPNPCLIDINGVVVGISTNDIIRELHGNELHAMATSQSDGSTGMSAQSTPSKSSSFVQLTSTPSTNGGATRPALMTNKTVRVVSQILSQQSFAPISTSLTFENLTLQEAARSQLAIPFKPDILLLPSKARFFAEIVPMPGSLASHLPLQDPSESFIQEHGHVIAVNPQSVCRGGSLGTYAMITLYHTNNTEAQIPQNEDIVDRASVEIFHL